MTKIILTRPLDDSMHLAAELATLGIEALLAPMLEIEPLSLSPEKEALLNKEYSHVMISSRHALKSVHALPSLLQTPLCAVGAETAQKAKQAGFLLIRHEAESMQSLCGFIKEEGSTRPRILYLRGEDIRQHPQDFLPDARIDEIITYRAAMQSTLDEDVLSAIRNEEGHGVVFYSIRTAESFLKAAAAHGVEVELRKLKAFCLSPFIARALPQEKFHSIFTASAPNHAAMLNLLKEHFGKTE